MFYLVFVQKYVFLAETILIYHVCIVHLIVWRSLIYSYMMRCLCCFELIFAPHFFWATIQVLLVGPSYILMQWSWVKQGHALCVKYSFLAVEICRGNRTVTVLLKIWSPLFDGDATRFKTLASFLFVLLFFWHTQVLRRFMDIWSPLFVTRFWTLASFLFVLLFYGVHKSWSDSWKSGHPCLLPDLWHWLLFFLYCCFSGIDKS